MRPASVRQNLTAWIAGRIAGHATLCVGVLYGAAIAAVLAVTRMF